MKKQTNLASLSSKKEQELLSKYTQEKGRLEQFELGLSTFTLRNLAHAL